MSRRLEGLGGERGKIKKKRPKQKKSGRGESSSQSVKKKNHHGQQKEQLNYKERGKFFRQGGVNNEGTKGENPRLKREEVTQAKKVVVKGRKAFQKKKGGSRKNASFRGSPGFRLRLKQNK